MSKMNRYTGTLLTCAVELVIGILLLIAPVGFTTGIIIVLGLALMAAGLVGVTMIVEAAADCLSDRHRWCRGAVPGGAKTKRSYPGKAGKS